MPVRFMGIAIRIIITFLALSGDCERAASGDSPPAPAATPAHTGKVISVADFGAKPDSKADAVEAIRAAIEACRKQGAATLVFPKGRYDLRPARCEKIEYYESNTTDNNPKTCAIVLKDIKNLTIVGNGSELICHGIMQPITLENCQGVTVRDLDTDWDIPIVAQAKVVLVEVDHIDIRINRKESPYEIENGKIVFHGEGWKSGWWGCMEFDANSRIIPPRSGDSPLGGGWHKYQAVESGDGLVRLNLDFKRKPKQGNILIMRHSARDHAWVFIYRCKDTLFENVNLFAAAGLGFLGQYSENITLKRTNVMPNYAKGRYQSGHADGFQVSNCRGHVVVDGCKFEGLMDDPINVHGTSVKIVEIKRPDRVVGRFMHGMSTGMTWGRAGDKVGFVDHKDLATVAEGTIKSYSKIDRDRFEVRFDQAVPKEIAAGDAMENLTWAPDFSATLSAPGQQRPGCSR